MKAWVISEIKEIKESNELLKLTNIELPELKDNEVLVKISACGICHTEIDEIEGRAKPSFLPIIPGHQIVGKVVSIKKPLKNIEAGDRVGIGWIYSSCGNCYYCKNGLENLCSKFHATGKDVHGGYAEYIIAKSNYIYKIPFELSDIEAAPLLCAGAIGYRSLKLTGINNGENIGLTGFGASAHIVVKIIKYLYPHSKIFVFARNKKEQEFALELGCFWAGDIDAKPTELMKAIIDTTPVWHPVLDSLNKLQPGGRLVINAIRKEENDKNSLLKLDYQTHLWMEKEIKSVANITTHDIEEFLDLVKKINLKPVVEIYNFNEVNKALKDIKFQKIKGAKVLLIN